MNGEDKPLFWVGASLDDLSAFPPPVKKVMGFALRQAQQGGKHIHAKPLKGKKGASVLEIVQDYDTNTYRGVYTVKFHRRFTYYTHFRRSRKAASKRRSPT